VCGNVPWSETHLLWYTILLMAADPSSSVVRLINADEYVKLREVRLSALAYSDHLAEHLAKESEAPPSFWRERAKRGAAGVTMATYVAVDQSGFDGVVDGFIHEDDSTLEIGGMWVRLSHRRRGIGRALLEAVCEWGRERDARCARLWVRASNDPARLLYEGEGFRASAACWRPGRARSQIGTAPLIAALAI
jgi:ribosomal protein S18 acetylase RimI-like enzyme